MNNYKVIYTYLEGDRVHAEIDTTLADSKDRAASNTHFWHSDKKGFKIVNVYKIII